MNDQNNEHTGDLAVDGRRDAGQRGEELKEDVVDHVTQQRTQLFSHKF